MPKLPAPTYSPSTSFGSPTGIPPQRSFARSSLPQQGPAISSATAGEPWPTLAKETTVSADMLYTYLSESRVSVLLLDVRSRDEFDQGHIFARRIVCIEPIVLRDG
jgi:ubiquitin carboxyl-terminal hydrolase 8